MYYNGCIYNMLRYMLLIFSLSQSRIFINLKKN